MLRSVAVLAGLLAAGPALAGEMSAEEAQSFVVGKSFHYNCFEGTRGQGRVYSDGSVVGSVQFQGSGQVRYAHLPPGTLRVKGQSVCASLRGLPIQPCFTLQKIDEQTFRGSIYGLSFASCEFTRHHSRAHVAHRTSKENPLALRPSLTAENE